MSSLNLLIGHSTTRWPIARLYSLFRTRCIRLVLTSYSSHKNSFFLSFDHFRPSGNASFFISSLFENRIIIMYRLFAIASSLLLLIGSSAALTVVGNKPAGFTPIQLDLDLGSPAAEANNGCALKDRMGPSSRRSGASSYGPVSKSSNACCADYPMCSCPKLETPVEQTTFKIELPTAKQAKTDSTCSCCPDYPYCSCPKLETPKPRFQVIDVGAATKRRPKVSALRMVRPKALVGAGKASGGCCPDYPYCGCPKI